MSEIRQPHDHFFQRTFSQREVAADFLHRYLPDPIATLLDFSVLELTKDSFVDEALQDHFVEDIHAAVVRVFPEEGKVLMATAAEQWIERGKELGIAIGERQGMMAAIELGLELKFGVAGLQLLPAIRQIQGLDILRTLYEGIKTARTLDELRALYNALVA